MKHPLSPEQTEWLLDALESMLGRVPGADGEKRDYVEGVRNGLNAVHRVLRGDPDEYFDGVLTRADERDLASRLIAEWSRDPTLQVGVPYRRMASEAAALATPAPRPRKDRIERIREKLDALNGRGPGGKNNYAYGDGYFASSIEREFGASIEELAAEVRRNAMDGESASSSHPAGAEHDITDRAVAAREWLRQEGWSVAVHNDYRLDGEAYTFWLWTHPNGRYVKGEGRTDAQALDECLRAARRAGFATQIIQALAERFAVSPPAVVRWLQGRNAPHPAMQQQILESLSQPARGPDHVEDENA